MEDVSSLGPIGRFRVTARNELRALMIGTGQATLELLLANLDMEARTEGINIGSWPYLVDGPFDQAYRDLVTEIKMKYNEWIAAGKPNLPNF